MIQKKAIFLFDYTGIMAKPWADAGYLCYCFDGQHNPGVSMTEHKNILNIGMWFSNVDSRCDIDAIKEIVGTGVVIVFGFPDCTDLTVAGARHFKKKASINPSFQHQAMQLVYLTKLLGEELECSWAFENPVSVISTLFRKPDFKFNPCDYGGYLPESDINPIYPEIYPGNDAYNKKTCIWHGGGFKEPSIKRVEPLHKDNPGWKKAGGKSLKTKNIRSATPRGFAIAVFEANQIKDIKGYKMKYEIVKELKKIEALVEYANKLVDEKASKEKYRLAKSYIVEDVLNDLFYVTGLFPVFNGKSGVTFTSRELLFKKINGRFHYITLLKSVNVRDGNWFDPYCIRYEVKADIDDCPALEELKTRARAMIKNPDQYFRASIT